MTKRPSRLQTKRSGLKHAQAQATQAAPPVPQPDKARCMHDKQCMPTPTWRGKFTLTFNAGNAWDATNCSSAAFRSGCTTNALVCEVDATMCSRLSNTEYTYVHVASYEICLFVR